MAKGVGADSEASAPPSATTTRLAEMRAAPGDPTARQMRASKCSFALQQGDQRCLSTMLNAHLAWRGVALGDTAELEARSLTSDPSRIDEIRETVWSRSENEAGHEPKGHYQTDAFTDPISQDNLTRTWGTRLAASHGSSTNGCQQAQRTVERSFF